MSVQIIGRNHIHPASLLLHARLRLRAAGRAILRAWHDAERAAASRRNLVRMDDRMLADIGVAPGDVPSRPMRLEWDRPRV